MEREGLGHGFFCGERLDGFLGNDQVRRWRQDFGEFEVDDAEAAEFVRVGDVAGLSVEVVARVGSTNTELLERMLRQPADDWSIARMAQVALREIAAGNTDPFYQAKLQTARFYFARLFPETASLMMTVRAGARVLMDTEAVLA